MTKKKSKLKKKGRSTGGASEASESAEQVDQKLNRVEAHQAADAGRIRRRVVKRFTQPSLTQQQFKDECDPNLIMRRFTQTGFMPQRAGFTFQSVPATDFKSAMDLVLNTQDNFETLPSELRAHFQNDPARLLTFLSDEANREEAIRLGLIETSAPPAGPATSENEASQSETPSPENDVLTGQETSSGG